MLLGEKSFLIYSFMICENLIELSSFQLSIYLLINIFYLTLFFIFFDKQGERTDIKRHRRHPN